MSREHEDETGYRYLLEHGGSRQACLGIVKGRVVRLSLFAEADYRRSFRPNDIFYAYDDDFKKEIVDGGVRVTTRLYRIRANEHGEVSKVSCRPVSLFCDCKTDNISRRLVVFRVENANQLVADGFIMSSYSMGVYIGEPADQIDPARLMGMQITKHTGDVASVARQKKDGNPIYLDLYEKGVPGEARLYKLDSFWCRNAEETWGFNDVLLDIDEKRKAQFRGTEAAQVVKLKRHP